MHTDPLYEYYLRQAGYGNIPVFSGPAIQYGYGVGGIFRSLFKFIRPVFQALKPAAAKILPSVGSELARASSGFISDIASGHNVGQAAKSRFVTAGENLRDRAVNAASQLGRGIKRKKPVKRLQYAKRPRRGKSDIFA